MCAVLPAESDRSCAEWRLRLCNQQLMDFLRKLRHDVTQVLKLLDVQRQQLDELLQLLQLLVLDVGELLKLLQLLRHDLQPLHKLLRGLLCVLLRGLPPRRGVRDAVAAE
jgi:hypothetical protein